MDIFKNVETYEIDYGVNEINLSIVYNDKTLNLLNDPNFDFNIKVYNEFINKKIENTKLFNNNFSLEQLREVINKCSKNYFFKAGHKLLLDSKEYDESEANILYKTELEKIYNNQDSKDKFDSIKKQIKNAHTKDLSKYLDQNKHLLKYLPYRKMIETIILNQFKINENSKNEIEELINQLNSINLKIKSTVENERSLWEKIIETYNDRFINNGFCVTIDNLDEIKINDDILPVIVIKNKSHQLITDKNKKRLSSGEQRCFNILRLILEYESLKTNDKLIIILDDIVDSFDYKNKYSILEYIDEIANSSTNVQLFCLTHNFDFFRNCSNLFKENSKFLFGNNKNGNVELREAKQDWFKNYHFYKNLKNSNTVKGIIFCIPFLRNISELISNESNKKNKQYEILSNYLHYNVGFEELTFTEIEEIMKLYSVKYDKARINSKYWEELLVEVKKIILDKKLDETNLVEKVILAIFLRIFSEMSKKGKIKCSESINPLINRIKVISSNIIHINSFMYEPLIDVSIDEIKKVSNKCLDFLSNQ